MLSSSFRDKQELYRRFDAYYDYACLSNRIAKKKNAFIKRYVSVAVVILLFIFSGLFYWLHDSAEKSISKSSQVLLPGKPTANLILADDIFIIMEHRFRRKHMLPIILSH